MAQGCVQPKTSGCGRPSRRPLPQGEGECTALYAAAFARTSLPGVAPVYSPCSNVGIPDTNVAR